MARRAARLLLVAVLALTTGTAVSGPSAVADPGRCVRAGSSYAVSGFAGRGYVVNNHCGGHYYARINVHGRWSHCQYVDAHHGFFVHTLTASYFTVSLCDSGPKSVGGRSASGCGQVIRRFTDFGKIVYVARNVCSTARRLEVRLTKRALKPRLGCITVPAHGYRMWGSPVSDPATVHSC